MSGQFLSRTRVFNRILFLVVVCTLGLIGFEVVANSGGQPNFQGATEGIAVDFEVVPLPLVAGSPGAAFHAQESGRPFIPSFAQLVSGEIVITSNAEMRHVWHRLFHEPYDPSQFDFDSSFVAMMGNGLQHPYFGFEITDVEQFTATFQSGDTYLEYPLAIVGTETLPGPKPPPMDPVYKLSAVKIANDLLGDIIFSRQVLALP